PGEFDFFNLGEHLAFSGRPDIPVLWAISAGTDYRELLSHASRVIVVIDPSAVPASQRSTLMAGLTAYAARLDVFLLDDHSELAQQVNAERNRFARYLARPINHDSLTSTDLQPIGQQILQWQEPAETQAEGARLWTINRSYFPTWKTEAGASVWLTGQGTIAAIDSGPAVLNWRAGKWTLASGGCGLAGLLIAFFRVRWNRRRGFNRRISKSKDSAQPELLTELASGTWTPK
ncbi:MAG TPA: hypothetical protein VE961_10820, partial [Pyrinomonadaceae bacterium]|nr:hypothetical protein [Pyrinomonadaceae bacterium]